MKWSTDYQAACNYRDAAKGLWEKKKVDNETIYNIVSLAVEQYASTLTSWLNFMPVHSGLVSVFRELKKRVDMPEHFTDQVRFLNKFMTYCSLDIMPKVEISDEETAQMLIFMEELGQFVHQTLETATVSEPHLN